MIGDIKRFRVCAHQNFASRVFHFYYQRLAVLMKPGEQLPINPESRGPVRGTFLHARESQRELSHRVECDRRCLTGPWSRLLLAQRLAPLTNSSFLKRLDEIELLFQKMISKLNRVAKIHISFVLLIVRRPLRQDWSIRIAC